MSHHEVQTDTDVEKRTLTSPNELMEAAQKNMLNGQAPKSNRDWVLIVNFWAFNIAPGLEESATILMAKIFDCPLSTHIVAAIAKAQADTRE